MSSGLLLEPGRTVSRRTIKQRQAWQERSRLEWREYTKRYPHLLQPRNAIAHVQDAAVGSSSSATTLQTSAFGSQPTVGNYIVAFAWGWDNATHTRAPAFADTGVNTYTIPTNAYQQQATDLWCAAGYAKVTTAGASFKITLTGVSVTNATMSVCAAEFSGIASSSPEDGAAVGNTGSTGAPAPGSKSITSGSLVCIVMVDDNSGNPSTVTTPTGFTRVGVQTNGASFEVGEGAYAINPTSPSNPSWNSVAFKWCAAQFALLLPSSGQDTPELYGRPYGSSGQRQQGQLLSQ